MARIQLLDGWRFHPERSTVESILCPPLDSLDEPAIQALYRKDPCNVIRLMASVHPGEPGDGATHLDVWSSHNLLYHDKPALYLIEQSSGSAQDRLTRRGLLLRVPLDEDDLGGEAGSENGVQGELLRMRALRGQVEPTPVLLVPGEESFAPLLESLVSWEATVEVRDEGGVTTRLWVVDRPEALDPIVHSAGGATLYPLGGAARTAAARIYRDEVRSAMEGAGVCPPELGALPVDSLMVALFPVDEEGLRLPADHPLRKAEEAVDAAVATGPFPSVPTGLVLNLFR
ncbi:MAG: DUF1015 family protein [Planctomycetota bacterium]|jgi:hypothetical protein